MALWRYFLLRVPMEVHKFSNLGGSIWALSLSKISQWPLWIFWGLRATSPHDQNDHHGISYHQQLNCLFNRQLLRLPTKTSTSLALCEGNPLVACSQLWGHNRARETGSFCMSYDVIIVLHSCKTSHNRGTNFIKPPHMHCHNKQQNTHTP